MHKTGIFILSLCLVASLVNAQERKVGVFDKIRKGFFSLFTELDILKVGDDQPQMTAGSQPLRQFLDSLHHEFNRLEGDMKHALRDATSLIRGEFASFRQSLQSTLPLVTKDSLDTRSINKMQHAWERVHDVATIQALRFESTMRERTREFRNKLNTLLEDSHGDSLVSKHAQELKADFLKFEHALGEKARSLANLFRRNTTVESHHHVHHPFIQCGVCGKTMSMAEFVDTYDPHHTLLVIEEDFWTDQEVEEFWEGWIEYANRLRLHCPCGASKWAAVQFDVVDDNGQHVKRMVPPHDIDRAGRNYDSRQPKKHEL